MRHFSLKNVPRFSFSVLTSGILIMLMAGGCPPPSPTPMTPAKLPLIVGMEYAFPGVAEGFSELRLPGVKFMPDIIGWDSMQSGPNAPIRFTTLDGLVKEYQGIGFAESMVGLKSESSWASVAPHALIPDTNFAPKPEYLDEYAAWVRAVVERYDGDGIDDMPGLEHPIRYYEIGVEFSTFEPEPVGDYLTMLEAAYAAAHEAYPGVTVLHAAFLVGDPLGITDSRVMYHPTEDILAVLDRPDLFDAVNVHCLAGASELEGTLAWLRDEMDLRAYEKPLIISDTSPSPFVGWGRATTCAGDPSSLGIILPPGTEDDRCRLADYFTDLVNKDPETLEWVRGFVAADMARMVVVSAEQGVEFINTAFMEDITPMQAPLFGAAAGNSAWSGMVASTINLFTGRHRITGRYPMFYALGQLAEWMDNCDEVVREDAGDPHIRLYRLRCTEALSLPDAWIAWYDPGALYLPEDVVPGGILSFATTATEVSVETLITEPGQTEPVEATVTPEGGVADIALTPVPVLITPIP